MQEIKILKSLTRHSKVHRFKLMYFIRKKDTMQWNNSKGAQNSKKDPLGSSLLKPHKLPHGYCNKIMLRVGFEPTPFRTRF